MTKTASGIIGSEAMAREALYLHLSGEFRTRSNWTVLGSGISRTAYLAPDGVVYKVGYSDDNKNDAAAYAFLSKLPHPIYSVPVAAEYIPIMQDEYGTAISVCAMEYIDGEVSWATSEAGAYFGHTDLHSGNIRMKDNRVYCIDNGFFRSDKVRYTVVTPIA